MACADPAEQILVVAEREKCDLIAIVLHGHRFVKAVFPGSVAGAVRHRAYIAVLLHRAKTG